MAYMEPLKVQMVMSVNSDILVTIVRNAKLTPCHKGPFCQKWKIGWPKKKNCSCGNVVRVEDLYSCDLGYVHNNDQENESSDKKFSQNVRWQIITRLKFYVSLRIMLIVQAACGVPKVVQRVTAKIAKSLWKDLNIMDQIGEGSTAIVHQGRWNGTCVALKIFSKKVCTQDLMRSFNQEVFIMKQLRHPNILLFMSAIASPEGRLCIVTEFLHRGSLQRVLQRDAAKLDWKRRAHMAMDIARGMNYLHQCDPPVIHRDLKSSNLLVHAAG